VKTGAVYHAARFLHERCDDGELAMRQCFIVFVFLTAGVTAAAAQTPAPPAAPAPSPPPWTGSAGLGLSLNRGNTDTTNFNVSFEATYDPKTQDVLRFKGLYLRGDNNGSLAVDRLDLLGRYERSFTERVYGFAQLQFLKDHFKQIDYLWAPSAGIGYKLIATPTTTFNVDGGLGFKVEQDKIPATATEPETTNRHTDAVVSGSDKFEYNISKTSKITQGFIALWNVDDFGNAIYTFSAGIAASMTTRTQLKVELLNTTQTRPPSPGVKNNDVALLTTLVYKF
jgi:putative salt-induced outer membrane protein